MKMQTHKDTVWTVNDVLVDPYPCNAVKNGMDRPETKKGTVDPTRLWIDQDVIDSPHFI